MKKQHLPVEATDSRDQVSQRNGDRSPKSSPSLSKRAFLGAGGAALLAGCLGDDTEMAQSDDGSDVVPDIPRVEDPPAAVYVPTHRETMAHLPPVYAGEYALSPMITYPHQFWTVTGSETELVLPPDRSGVHLMVTPWDPVTELVLPIDSGATFRISLHGDVIETVTPWPMLSQTMGFHFGDNLPLPVDDTYTIEIELPPLTTRKEGTFEGRFEEAVTGSFEFVYDEDFRQRLIENVEYLDEQYWGERGTLEPLDHGDVISVEGRILDDMEHEGDGHSHHENGMAADHDHRAPYSTVPRMEDYPGRTLGDPTSGDAIIGVQYLDADDALLVSPRTPYNRIPLADMAMTVTGAVEGELTQTIDPTLGLHYRLEESLEPGDSITIVFDSPPQVSRHAGFETAFLAMDPVEVTMPE